MVVVLPVRVSYERGTLVQGALRSDLRQILESATALSHSVSLSLVHSLSHTLSRFLSLSLSLYLSLSLPLYSSPMPGDLR